MNFFLIGFLHAVPTCDEVVKMIRFSWGAIETQNPSRLHRTQGDRMGLQQLKIDIFLYLPNEAAIKFSSSH